MKAISLVRMLTLAAPVLGALLLLEPSSAQQSAATSTALPSETPAKFKPATDSFDYLRRDVMVPMRDGVKLHTVILVPKHAKAAPILLTRTPYDATALTTHAQQCPLGTGSQRLRQRHRSDYRRGLHPRRAGRARQARLGRRLCVARPLRGPQNPTAVDHATDTYDTIEWLVIKTFRKPTARWALWGFLMTGFCH